MIGTQIYDRLNKLLHVVRILVHLFLINDKNEAIDTVLVVAPQVRVLAVQVPHLKRASFGDFVLKVVKGLCEEDFGDWIQ